MSKVVSLERFKGKQTLLLTVINVLRLVKWGLTTTILTALVTKY